MPGKNEMTEIECNPKIFRPGSTTNHRNVNFILHEGGLGDYIGYMAVVEWIAKNCPHVFGYLYASDFFEPLARFFMEKYPKWTVLPYSLLTEDQIKKAPTFGPHKTPINGAGSHPTDLASIFYLNLNPAPKDAYYPNYDPTKHTTTHDLPENYAIMCPGVGGKNRELHVETFKAIKDHLTIRNLTPVFLGKRNIPERKVLYFPKYDLSNGIDLVDQTSLIESLHIISRAKLIVGIDNGLLHLAGCTDIPIIFGYTIASPQHRRPRRFRGKTYELYPDTHRLTCTFCQSKMRLMFDHDFAKCLYQDYYCLKELADPTPWRRVIDQALEETL